MLGVLQIQQIHFLSVEIFISIHSIIARSFQKSTQGQLQYPFGLRNMSLYNVCTLQYWMHKWSIEMVVG